MTFASCNVVNPNCRSHIYYDGRYNYALEEVASCTSYDGNMNLLGLVDLRSE